MNNIFQIAVIFLLLINNFIESSSSEASSETDLEFSKYKLQARQQLDCYLHIGRCNPHDALFRELLPLIIIHGCATCYPKLLFPTMLVTPYEMFFPDEWKRVTEMYGPPILIAVDD